jgi:hypothetical protein
MKYHSQSSASSSSSSSVGRLSSGLLSEHISGLRLNSGASFPSEMRDATEMILAYRRSQQKVKLSRVPPHPDDEPEGDEECGNY